jgi:hypothetical protein
MVVINGGPFGAEWESGMSRFRRPRLCHVFFQAGTICTAPLVAEDSSRHVPSTRALPYVRQSMVIQGCRQPRGSTGDRRLDRTMSATVDRVEDWPAKQSRCSAGQPHAPATRRSTLCYDAWFTEYQVLPFNHVLVHVLLGPSKKVVGSVSD